jgi:adenylate kinase family enzyme
MIIHICGAPGSGKTTLGKKLNEIKKRNVIVFDLDEVFDEFMSNHRFNSSAYQKFLNNLIKKHTQKHIIIVGLNMDKGHTSKLYNLHADYDIYIDINEMVLLERLFYREVKQINKHKKMIWQDYLKDPNEISLRLAHNVNINALKKETRRFDKIYTNTSYQLMTIGAIKKLLRKLELII